MNQNSVQSGDFKSLLKELKVVKDEQNWTYYLCYNSVGEDIPPTYEDCSHNKVDPADCNNIDCDCISKYNVDVYHIFDRYPKIDNYTFEVELFNEISERPILRKIDFFFRRLALSYIYIYTCDTKEVIVDYTWEYFIERDCTRWNSRDTRMRLMQFLEQVCMVTDDDDSFLVTYFLCCKFKNNLQEQDYYTSILLGDLEERCFSWFLQDNEEKEGERHYLGFQ